MPQSSQNNGKHKAPPQSAAWPWLPAILESSSTHYRNKELAAHFSEGQTLQTFSCSPSFSGGHTSRVWHPTQASQNCRARIVGPWLLTEPAPQPEHKQDTLITLPEVSYCSSCPATQAVTGSAAHPPASPQLHFLCRTPVRIPSCSGNKGREWLAAPFCISCFPLSSLTSDVRCHILYFI